MRIGLISDTHSYLDEAVFRHFGQCDEIWHAGDFGMASIAASLAAFRPLRAVYGNIDGHDVRSSIPETLVWNCEQVKVLMTHIGGYPPAYNKNAKALLDAHKPQLFICGHSHILRIMYDDKRNCLHMNPGAAGKQGWHAVRTLIRFTISGNDIRDCEVIELGAK